MIGLFIEQRVDLPGAPESSDVSLFALLNTNVAGAWAVVVPGVPDTSGIPNDGNLFFNNIVMNDRDFLSTLIHKHVVCVAGL